MKKFIYSKLLEEHFPNRLEYKSVRRIYKLCMPKYIHVDECDFFEMSVWKAASDLVSSSIAMDKQMHAQEYIQERAYPYYYFNLEDEKHYLRYFMNAPNDEIILNIFKNNKLMVLL